MDNEKPRKKEISVLGLIDEGFAKICKVVQQEDGSLYFTYKIMGFANHQSRHADGTRALTLGDSQTVPLEKAKPLEEIEFVQETFQAGSTAKLEKIYDITPDIKRADGIFCIDLRGYKSFGISVHYSAPHGLNHIKNVLKFLKNNTDVYISTETNPYTVIVVKREKDFD